MQQTKQNQDDAMETSYPTSSGDALQAKLIDMTQQNAWLMQALRTVRELGLASWCIGAGAVRNMVWDCLHECLHDGQAPSNLPDVDVVYFDAQRIGDEHDAALQARLRAALPDVPWEVTNQAGVHLWFEDYFGHAVVLLNSLEEAVASWPEYATSVGLRLEADDSLTVIAPHGLDDLFGLVVRRNPVRVSVETYRERVAQKRYAERWPRVTVVPC
jgi:hypothetical protein